MVLPSLVGFVTRDVLTATGRILATPVDMGALATGVLQLAVTTTGTNRHVATIRLLITNVRQLSRQ